MKITNGTTLFKVLGKDYDGRDIEELKNTKFSGNYIKVDVLENGKDLMTLHQMDNGCYYNIEEDFYYESIEGIRIYDLKVGQVIELEPNNYYIHMTIKKIHIAKMRLPFVTKNVESLIENYGFDGARQRAENNKELNYINKRHRFVEWEMEMENE